MDLKDIENKVAEVVTKAQSDPEFLHALEEDPIQAVEDLFGIKLPEEQVMAMAAAFASDMDENGDGDEEEILGQLEDQIDGLFQ